MPRLFLLFNHVLTPEQEKDARDSIGIHAVITPPDHVRNIWRQVPPDLFGVSEYLEPVRQWLLSDASAGDHVLIQGDFGACFLMAGFALEHGLVPVYSTTRREATETKAPDGSVQLIHHFRHRQFRLHGV